MRVKKNPSDQDWRWFFSICYEEYVIDKFIESLPDGEDDGWYMVEDDET